MSSMRAKWLLTLTSVAPAFGAASIIALTSHDSITWALIFLFTGVACVFITFCVIWNTRKYVRIEPLNCSKVEQADPKVLEFLLAYLLPMFSSTKLDDLAGSVSLTIYSLAIVILAVVYGNIFQFNPVLAVFGYHFYVVTEVAPAGEEGMKYLLISKKAFHKTNFKIHVKRLDDYTFLDSDL